MEEDSYKHQRESRLDDRPEVEVSTASLSVGWDLEILSHYYYSLCSRNNNCRWPYGFTT